MNKRDTLLSLIHDPTPPDYIPAAFFMHFEKAYHAGQAAIDKHLEFFRSTGMDFVKIQYEQPWPDSQPVRQAADWANLPRCPESFFEPTVRAVEGLVKAAKNEALVVLTLYSPFMWARHLGSEADLAQHLKENPQAVKKGLEIVTKNVLNLVRACKRVGVDGFYASSQGSEAFRFPGTDIFQKYIKPTDRVVWEEIKSCTFNILHICDYEGSYDDLTPFLDYPGHVVNASLKVGQRTLTPKEVSQMFKRPFMGGLERKSVIATGNLEEIRQATKNMLAQAPDRFILAADCTVPSETSWENLKTAIDVAHQFKRAHS
jgi:uroporphyrinogen decarboxylase